MTHFFCALDQSDDAAASSLEQASCSPVGSLLDDERKRTRGNREREESVALKSKIAFLTTAFPAFLFFWINFERISVAYDSEILL